MFYSRAMRKLKLVSKEIQEIERRLKKMPEGNFTCQSNGRGSYKWRVNIGKNQSYIHKNNPRLAEKYAFKTYLTYRLKRLKNEENGIKAYLKIHDRYTNKKEAAFLVHPEYQKLLSHYFMNTKEKMQKWMNAPFPTNTSHMEHLIHDTASGVVTRSKSEQMIEAALRKYNLPFRYEEKMVLGEMILYPDFKIVHPRTGAIIIWENVGKSDDPKYMKRFWARLHNYFMHGYYPTVNLILTFDTEKYPLTTDRIERIIEMYFDV